jgi:4'-phosphopantetheinyl transferase EntD
MDEIHARSQRIPHRQRLHVDNCEYLFKDTPASVICCPVLGGLRRHLTAGESQSYSSAVNAVLDRAAASRIAARKLLESVGVPDWSMPRKPGNPPDWPAGWVGSLSHSDQFGAAAIASGHSIAGVGIDVELAEPLPSELVNVVVGRGDVAPGGAGDMAERILFSAKEATYKALYPLDRRYLEFHEVLVDFDSGMAQTRYGRQVNIWLHLDHRIVVLATVVADTTTTRAGP